MRIESNRDVGQLWLVSTAVFAVSVGIVRSLGRDESVRTTALWIGYVGLAAIGVALLLTWQWLNHGGPRSLVVRVPLRLTVVTGIVLWVVALVFPFL
jgi:hypothetical protein